MSELKKNKAKELGPRALRILILIAMLTAMTIALERTPGLSIKTPGWKICFGFVPPMIAGALLGPFAGAAVYGLGDLIGALLFPFGPYHPGFTITAALMGFMFGLFFKSAPFGDSLRSFKWNKIRAFPNVVVPVVVNALVLGLVVNTLWVSQLYGSKTYGGWFMYRLWEYVILVPVEFVLAPGVLKLCGLLGKTGIMKRINEKTRRDEQTAAGGSADGSESSNGSEA